MEEAMQRVLDKLFERTTVYFQIAFWRLPGKGWLCSLLDEEQEYIPNSVNWDYHSTPLSAVEDLEKKLDRLIDGMTFETRNGKMVQA